MSPLKFFEPPVHQAAYDAWKKEPTPHTTGELLRSLDPVIEQGIRMHVGQSNPVIKSHARRLTLNALDSYQPGQSKLSTHVINHLQGLKRINRQGINPLRVPEALALEIGHLTETHGSLEAELGRPPTDNELADKTGIPPKRLNKLRQLHQPLSEGYFQPRGDEMDEYRDDPAIQLDHSHAYLDALHGDLGARDQFILENYFGYRGRQKIPGQRIASKLRITPGAVSQRVSSIKNRLAELQESGFLG